MIQMRKKQDQKSVVIQKKSLSQIKEREKVAKVATRAKKERDAIREDLGSPMKMLKFWSWLRNMVKAGLY